MCIQFLQQCILVGKTSLFQKLCLGIMNKTNLKYNLKDYSLIFNYILYYNIAACSRGL